MTLGSSNELDARIAEAEKYGLERAMFPFEVNGHWVAPLLNDGYGNDERIYLDLTLFCHTCGTESSIQGTVSSNPAEVVQAKFLALGKYLYVDCE